MTKTSFQTIHHVGKQRAFIY